jgi:hypothetical protein
MAASGCGPDKVEVPELKRAAASCC